MNEILHESLMDSVYKKARDIAARKEEVLEAFIAKYGYQPDEMVVCEQPSTGKFWVEKKNKWISVKDRLPEINQHVLVYDLGCAEYDETGIQSGKYTGKEDPWEVTHFCESSYYHKVTHWMLLPEPPEKE